MEEQRARALPETLSGDGNAIAGPSSSGIDLSQPTTAMPPNSSSPPATAMPPNASDVAGGKRKRHTEKKDKNAKKSRTTHQKHKKNNKRPNKHRKSNVASDKDGSSAEDTSNPSEVESGEDDEDEDEDEDDDEPVNTRLTHHTSMDPRRWKTKAATAVNTDDSISINVKVTNVGTVPLPPTAPFPLSQPPSPVRPLPASPPTPTTNSALTSLPPTVPLPPPPLSQPSSPVHPSPVGPSTPATASAVTPATRSKAPQEAVWPSWFADAHAFLSSQNLGPDFALLIEQFTDLERRTNFAPGARSAGFKPDNRPAEVHYWISRGRAIQPKVDKVSDFEKSWWKWWKGLQPDWRAVSDVVGPLDASHRSNLVDGADWSVVNKHGRNAFLSVMATLVWWGVALPTISTADEGWMAAVRDVGWVFTGLLSTRFIFFCLILFIC